MRVRLGSDIISLNVAGTSIIVLDTIEAAMELFEKRSSIYSNRYVLCCYCYLSDDLTPLLVYRARTTMVVDLMGWDFNFALMPYGEQYRTTNCPDSDII